MVGSAFLLRIGAMDGIVAGMEHGKCGTTAGYHRHTRKLKEPACDACKAAIAKYRRERRWANGGYKWVDAECGTRSGWVRHMKRGETACNGCREAQTAYMRGYRAEKRRKALRGTWNDVILDYLETWGAMSPLDLVRLISERHPDVNHNTVVKAVKRLEDRGLLDADRYAPNDVVYRVSDWYLENVG